MNLYKKGMASCGNTNANKKILNLLCFNFSCGDIYARVSKRSDTLIKENLSPERFYMVMIIRVPIHYAIKTLGTVNEN